MHWMRGPTGEIQTKNRKTDQRETHEQAVAVPLNHPV